MWLTTEVFVALRRPPSTKVTRAFYLDVGLFSRLVERAKKGNTSMNALVSSLLTKGEIFTDAEAANTFTQVADEHELKQLAASAENFLLRARNKFASSAESQLTPEEAKRARAVRAKRSLELARLGDALACLPQEEQARVRLMAFAARLDARDFLRLEQAHITPFQHAVVANQKKEEAPASSPQ